MKTQFVKIAAFGFALSFVYSCSSDNDSSNPVSSSSSYKQSSSSSSGSSLQQSSDSEKYKTVKIGEQIWMAENLNNDVAGSRCYGDNTANCEKYGRLYDWETAKMVCPDGWHLPSNAEWQILVDLAGGRNAAGKALKATSGWNTGSGYKLGTDDFGFAALPGGEGYSGSFDSAGDRGYWWSATENANSAYNRYMLYNDASVTSSNYSVKAMLYSVRCLQDK